MKKVLGLTSYFLMAQCAAMTDIRQDIIWRATHLIKMYGSQSGYTNSSETITAYVSTDRDVLRISAPVLTTDEIEKLKESPEVKEFVKRLNETYKHTDAPLTFRTVKDLASQNPYIYTNINDETVATNLASFDNIKNANQTDDLKSTKKARMPLKRSQSLTKRMGALILKHMHKEPKIIDN